MIALNQLTLLAETHLAEVSMNYREEVAPSGISIWWYALIPITVAVGALLVYKFVDRPPAIVNTPLGMLHEICCVHRIKGRSRMLLEEIAEVTKMDHPAAMFVGPEQFDAAVAKARSKIKFDKKQTSTLGLVRRKLFS